MRNKTFTTMIIASVTFPVPSHAEFCIYGKCYKDFDDIKKEVIAIQQAIIKTHADVINHNEQLPVIKNDIEKNKKDIENIGSDIQNIEDDSIKKIASINDNKRDVLINKKGISKNKIRIQDIDSTVKNNSISISHLSEDMKQFETKTNNRFQKLDQTVSKNHKKAMAGISAAMAMNAIPFIEGKTVSIGLGGGSYGGQGSMAFGSQFRISENIKSSTFLSYDSNKNVGVATGISFGW